MIVVKIIGGLGNQLFQYSYAKSLQQKGYKVKIDISAFKSYKLHGGYFLDGYLIDIEEATVRDLSLYRAPNIITKLKRKIGLENINFIEEDVFFFSENLLLPKDDSYIEGYFQSEKYFLVIRDVILKQISLKKNLSAYGVSIQKKISACNVSCSIHIRRGDYLTNAATNKLHGVLNLDYYRSSIELLEKRFSNNIQYFIFSDDIEWAADNLKINNSTLIENDLSRDPNEDIYLMSLCSHNIIANSSFSWWGAWLNKNLHKNVFAPKAWVLENKINELTFHLIPNNWTRV